MKKSSPYATNKAGVIKPNKPIVKDSPKATVTTGHDLRVRGK